jgi:hypothetical protein
MPRVQKRTARKDYPKFGIKKGDEYFTWAFYRGPEIKSKTYPKASQLTQNEAHSMVYAAYEGEIPDTEEGIRDIISELEQARDIEQEKLDNMPEGFQQGDVGQRIENNVSSIEQAINDLEQVISDMENGEMDSDEIKEAVSGTEPELE